MLTLHSFVLHYANTLAALPWYYGLLVSFFVYQVLVLSTIYLSCHSCESVTYHFVFLALLVFKYNFVHNGLLLRALLEYICYLPMSR